MVDIKCQYHVEFLLHLIKYNDLVILPPEKPNGQTFIDIYSINVDTKKEKEAMHVFYFEFFSYEKRIH